VASGDPRPSSVMLWTRAVGEAASATVELRLEVATDEAFEQTLVSHAIEAGPDSDHTVRVLVEDLDPDTIYFYRFVAGEARSRVGRSWTAPALDADVPVRLAWASCQDYSAGFYGAWRRMLVDDEASSGDDRIRFVLHVGDFVYETRGEGFQMALDDDLEPVMLVDADGVARNVPPFPSGGGATGSTGGTFAQTLDDYRHLYKTFLADEHLQAARARWPFVCTWDDHEMSDDCWQSQANYTDEGSTDEPSQRRRVAANRAWFEFIPAILSEAEPLDGVDPESEDFVDADVEDASYDDTVEVDEPNNSAAIESMTIYRRLRFGRHVDLVLTDSRSYRSDHALPEELSSPNPLVFHPRAGLPIEVVNVLDAGREANGGSPPDMAGSYANVRSDSPPGTLLGAAQKQWWKDVMASSTATFKVWGNTVPALRIRLDTTDVDLFAATGDLMLSPDAWDGYGTERKELMTFLRDQEVRNVVSLSGDHHSHFAGLVHDDHDADVSEPVMTDFAIAGISSTSQFAAIAGAIETAVPAGLEDVVAPVLKLIVYDATALGGTEKAAVNFNTLLQWGSTAATIAAETHDLEAAEAAQRDVNPHLRYVDTAANGFGLARFDGDEARVTLVTVERPLQDDGDTGSEIRGTAELVVPRVDGAPTLEGPELTGKKPFPLG
jgi:alkaline phosphatase D